MDLPAAATTPPTKDQRTKPKGSKEKRYTPLFRDEPNQTILVTLDVAPEHRTPKPTQSASWTLNRYRVCKEEQRYTPQDKEELRRAKESLNADADEEQRLRDRIANVAISSALGDMSEESDPGYQPCRRLVRVEDLEAEEASLSNDSVLGVHNASFFSESSSVREQQRSPSPDTTRKLFRNREVVSSEQIRAAVRSRRDYTLKGAGNVDSHSPHSARSQREKRHDRRVSVGSMTSDALFRQTEELFSSPPEKPQGVAGITIGGKHAEEAARAMPGTPAECRVRGISYGPRFSSSSHKLMGDPYFTGPSGANRGSGAGRGGKVGHRVS